MTLKFGTFLKEISNLENYCLSMMNFDFDRTCHILIEWNVENRSQKKWRLITNEIRGLVLLSLLLPDNGTQC